MKTDLMQTYQNILHLGSTLIWGISLAVYIWLLKYSGRFHLIIFSLYLISFFLISIRKTSNNAEWRLKMAGNYPWLGIILLGFLYLSNFYISKSTLEPYPNSLEEQQLILSILFILILYLGERLALTRRSIQISSIITIVCSLLLIGRIWEASSFVGILFVIFTFLWIYKLRTKMPYMVRIQLEALEKHRKASDYFWMSCFNNSELSDDRRWKAFDNIQDENKLTDMFLRYQSVRTHFSKTDLEQKPDSQIRTAKNYSNEISYYPKILNKIKNWENRLRIFHFLSEAQRLKSIDECPDKEYLKLLINSEFIDISDVKKNNEDKATGIFNKISINKSSIWNQTNSGSLLK